MSSFGKSPEPSEQPQSPPAVEAAEPGPGQPQVLEHQDGVSAPRGVQQRWPSPSLMPGIMKPNSCCSEMLLCHHVPGPRVQHTLSWRGAGWSDVRDSRRPGPAVLQDPNHGLLLATGTAQSLHPPPVHSVWDPESWSRRGAGPRRPSVRFAPDPPPSRSCHDASLRRVCLRVGLATAFCWFVN